MAQELKGCRVAILAADGFEQSELAEPMRALRNAGAEPHVVAPKSGEIQGWKRHDKADRIAVDRPLDQVGAEAYEALILPGGVMRRRHESRTRCGWVDQEACVDGKLLTSRGPDDLPAFCREMVRLFAAARQPAPAM